MNEEQLAVFNRFSYLIDRVVQYQVDRHNIKEQDKEDYYQDVSLYFIEKIKSGTIGVYGNDKFVKQALIFGMLNSLNTRKVANKRHNCGENLCYLEDIEDIEDEFSESDMEDYVNVQIVRKNIEEMINTLNPKEAKVLELRFGLEDGKTRILDEVGEVIGVTRERIRQIEAKALRKLRHPSRKQHLDYHLMSDEEMKQRFSNYEIQQEQLEKEKKEQEALERAKEYIRQKQMEWKKEKEIKVKIVNSFIELEKGSMLKKIAPIEKAYDYYLGLVLDKFDNESDIKDRCLEIYDKSEKSIRLIKICNIDDKKLLIFEFKSEYVKSNVNGVLASMGKYLKANAYQLKYINTLSSMAFDTWGCQKYFKIIDGTKEYPLNIMK